MELRIYENHVSKTKLAHHAAGKRLPDLQSYYGKVDLQSRSLAEETLLSKDFVEDKKKRAKNHLKSPTWAFVDEPT